MSPYLTTTDEIVARFDTTPERRVLLQGLLRYRRDLRNAGFVGWQWLDGSFFEDVEKLRGCAPKDIDIVSFVGRPASIQTQAQLDAFVEQHAGLLYRDQTKVNYSCDAFLVDVTFGPYHVVSQARYWFGLFSHQRVTAVWKGMVEIALPPNDIDAAARAALGVT